ncbi:MAG: cell division protein SepF [Candidatus Aenigmarchaeota archaeon]|nr:cell division protein SepF [Candidatus Aenigmarchaeota archaeon]
MGILDKFRGEEDYVELEQQSEAEEEKKIIVQVERIGNIADSDRIQKKLRDGCIMLVKIKDLRDKDMEELKRAVDRIKRTAMAINGDIAAIGEEWLLVCPASAKVYREAIAE